MKTDVKIEWMIDDSQLGITSGSVEDVPIDVDYIRADENDVIDAVEFELSQKYGVSMKLSRNDDDDGDFAILNLQEMLEDLKFDEFQEKTQYARM